MTDYLIRHFEQPDRCPYCGSADVQGQSVNIEQQTTTQRLGCGTCGRHWHDVYRLAALIDDRDQQHERRTTITGSASPASLSDRDLRQRDIVPPEALGACSATVIGVGAIGRQVALQLAAVGVPHLHLYDPQIVEPMNLAAQGYLEEDLGLPKAEATARLCTRINSQVAIDPRIQRFRRSDADAVGDCVFVCVDSIETRRLIWSAVRDRTSFLVDGRMSAEVIRVLSAADEASRNHYPTTFFAAAEAHVGSCTGRSTIYTANIAAGLMVEQFTRHLRKLPADADVTLNLLSSELTVMNPSGGG